MKDPKFGECQSALIDAVRAGEDPEVAAHRIAGLFPEVMTLQQLISGAHYCKAVYDRQAKDKADDIAVVRDLIERLPRILAKLEAAT